MTTQVVTPLRFENSPLGEKSSAEERQQRLEYQAINEGRKRCEREEESRYFAGDRGLGEAPKNELGMYDKPKGRVKG